MPDPTRPDSLPNTTSAMQMINGIAKKKSKLKQKRRKLVLQQTFVSGHRKFAVINGKMLVVGDYIEGAQLKQIHSGKVVILDKGRSKELTLISDLNIKGAER